MRSLLTTSSSSSSAMLPKTRSGKRGRDLELELSLNFPYPNPRVQFIPWNHFQRRCWPSSSPFFCFANHCPGIIHPSLFDRKLIQKGCLFCTITTTIIHTVSSGAFFGAKFNYLPLSLTLPPAPTRVIKLHSSLIANIDPRALHGSEDKLPGVPAEHL